MLHIENLAKRYGEHVVFERLTLQFGPACVALCDEDQTGKSTLLRIVAGELAPDQGSVRVAGQSVGADPSQARARVAWVPADCLIHAELTGRTLLERMAQEQDAALEDALELAHDLELGPHLDKRFEQMSTGTRRKVYLAATALGNPAVVVADGPTDGLDARARGVVAELFRHWARDRVVLFASHDAAMVEACDAQLLSLRETQ